MHDIEITLTPAGHLVLRDRDAGEAAPCDAWINGVRRGFAAGQAQGLFALAATRPELPPRALLSFWRDFGGLYLTQLCRTPETNAACSEPIDPPGPAVIEALVQGAPPMPGGEYLTATVLRDIWIDLDIRLRREVSNSGTGLAGWLKKHAPLWHQVGRVCFHLAENKQDPECPFAFLATYASRLSKAGRVEHQALGRALQEYAGDRDKRALVNLLLPVHRAAESSAFAKELVDSGDVFHALAWTPAEAYRLLRDVPLLEESGLLVRVPDWWRKRPRPRVAVTIGEKRAAGFGTEAMLDFKLELALGDQRLTDAEWRRLMNAENGLVFLKGQWVEIDRDRLSRTLSHWRRIEQEAAGGGLSFIDGMRLLAGAPADLGADEDALDDSRDWASVHAGDWLAGTLAGMRDPEQLNRRGPARAFVGVLRPYQETGRQWLWFVSSLGLGACLADDMGLGKTIQVLSLLVTLKENGGEDQRPSLLVLPASLLANWKAEIERFAPGLAAWFVHPSENRTGVNTGDGTIPPGMDLVLTTYGMMLRQPWLREQDWRLAILDEAQAIKNPAARQSRAVKQLSAVARIALTGTPVENRLSDLWSIFDFLCPGLLGSQAKFKEFVKSMERREHDRYAPLRNLVQPYILRRLKTDRSIIADLPDKAEVKAICGLSKRQAALYARSVEELSHALYGVGGIERRGLVLAYLMRFKQICNHPSHLLGDGGYAPSESGKFERLREICEEIAGRQEKALVFTQFREITAALAAFLTQVFGDEGLVMHGGTAVRKRRTLVDAFQREDGPPFFVLSLKAGGIGLNLTAASHVIHFDRWWNPAVENQATDRAFRIGQHRNVLVHKFICRGTVEEKIDALIDEKVALAEGILKGGAETLLTEMSDEELLKTVALDIDRAVIT